MENGWVSSTKARFSAKNFFAVQDVGSKRFSGYYSELCVDQKQQVLDEPVFANNSQCNIDSLVFDENNQE